MKYIVTAIAVFFSLFACSSKAQDASGIVGLLINDFSAAQANFTAAANRYPEGTDLNARFTADAQCMADRVAQLQGLSGAEGGEVKGIISLGSLAVIQAAELQARLAAGNDAANVNCDQVVGAVVRRINREALRALPSAILRAIVP